MASRLAYASLLASSALLFGACVITSSDSGDDPTPTTTTTTTTSDGGSGAGTSVGGTGGTGGEQTGGGGTGGTAPTCVPETGSGTTEAACEEMNITPAPNGQAMLCGVNYDEDPVGYVVCIRAFEIYTAGQAEDLQSCLAEVGVQDACEEQPVIDCIASMYDNACARSQIVDTCDGFAAACDPDPFDGEQCAADLNPMSDAGIAEVVDCINNADPELSCQDAYDECFLQVVTSA